MSSFYDICCEFFGATFEELEPMNFYRELFPEGELQKRDESNNWKYNLIAYELRTISRNRKSNFRWIIGDDLAELEELQKSESFSVLAPISYVGKRRTAKNARLLYALVFDLDGVKKNQHLKDLIHQMNLEILPQATFIACSGFGLHLWYQFEFPIPLFKNVSQGFDKLKHALTELIWNKYITDDYKNIQFQPINQPFRIVGGVTKDYSSTGHRVKIWRVNPHPTTLEYLNSFVSAENQCVVQYKSELTLSQAKAKFPEWYEKRIVNKQMTGSWTVKRDLYDWWKRQIAEKGAVGHRYYCIMCLAIYAKKCGIPFDELKVDAMSLKKHFDSLTTDSTNHFTKKDINDALKAYEDEKITMPRASIEHFCGFEIPKNKRNGRKQKQHLEGARAIQAIKDKYDGTNWREGNGRPSLEQVVLEYLKNNPGARKCDVARATGLHRHTVYKYYDECLKSLGQ